MKDVTSLVTDNLDIWTNAIERKSAAGRGKSKKFSFYGIEKLRALILDLAVRGKLVPQNSDDEPASELLERIKAEKAILIAEKKVKKTKPLSPIKDDNQPFNLPPKWHWSKLGDIGIVGSSRRVHKKNWTDNGVPFHRAREIVKLSKFDAVDGELFISEELFQLLSSSGFAPETDDLMITGVGTIGVPYVVKESDRFYFKDASVLIFKNYFGLLPEYLYLFMKSPYWVKEIHVGSMGTTVHTLTISRANKIPIPLPPVAEQQRIVDKVDELMALCDALEAGTYGAIEAHEVLVKTLLATLTNSKDAQDLASNWTRLETHFDALFTTVASIDQLKQTILQLAVMGKLVPQNPEDEPALDLLTDINTEKEKMISEGKIKKPKSLLPIRDEEKPFDLPRGWEWVRLGKIISKIGAGSTPRGGQKSYVEEGIAFLRSQNVWNDGLVLDGVARITEDVHIKMSGTHVRAGDLLFNITGASIGRCAVVPNTFTTGNVSQHVSIVRAVASEIVDMLHLVLISNYSQARVMEVQVGVSREGLSISKLGAFPIPLPPLAEQHRIVAKVDELMGLCETLKSRITGAAHLQKQFADTIVAKAVA